MRLIDSHCHIHEAVYYPRDQAEQAYQRAVADDIAMILIGTSIEGSREAIDFARNHEHTYAVLGVHPHETAGGYAAIETLLKDNITDKDSKIVGVGEIGLDYYYMHASREQQIVGLEQQLQYARDYQLPVSFHVRDYKEDRKESVWDDFWPIFDNFAGTRGVLHSFTDTITNLRIGLERGLYIGVNGIATFAPQRADVYRAIPLNKILLETDAPFLTPVPFRGTMNEPKRVEVVADYLAEITAISRDEIDHATTHSTTELFQL